MIRRGFTLIELLVVITILAILAGAALPYVQNYVAESRIAKAKTDLEEVARALAVYETREGDYPDTGIVTNDGLSDVSQLTGRYLNKAPIDPWGKPYIIDLNAGTVYSSGPDRASSNAGEKYDDISVPFQPPLALVSVKWVDKNQTGAVDDRNVPDEVHLYFSRKIVIPADAGAPADTIDITDLAMMDLALNISNLAGAETMQNQFDIANAQILPNRKVIVLPVQAEVAAAGGATVVATQFVAGNDAVQVNSGAAVTNFFYDKAGNKCLTDQAVVILPQ